MKSPFVVLAAISTLWLGLPSAAAMQVEEPPAAKSGPTAGQGAPVQVLAPTETTATVTVAVAVEAGQVPAAEDFRAGPLASTANPNLAIVPHIKVGPRPNAASPALVDVTVSGLTPFGELTVPLLYQLRQVDMLRFQKPGLLVVRGQEGEIIAQQKHQYLQLELENPSIHDYTQVAARVRFQGIEECRFGADQTNTKAPDPGQGWWSWVATGFKRSTPSDLCVGNDWSRFDVRGSSRVTLQIPLHDAWFEDVQSGLTRSAARDGMLTLRYFQQTGAPGQPLAEQNVPLSVRFEARSQQLFLSMLWIFILLAVGALIFLLLRVSIPNYRRKKDLKDQLNTLRAATERVSDQVDSQLRVLIRVERMALDQRRRDRLVILPGFDDLARQLESGIATLSRKIVLVERLDAATCRRENLVLGAVAPTRLEIIDRSLDAACEVLKNDQLAETDWLFVQQKLETADKALNEPSPEEKQAFEALLSTRWQSVRDHFKPADGSRDLTPKGLDIFQPCFPEGAVLPKTDDADGMGWIKAVGAVQADLQVTALELLREAHFRSHALKREKWKGAAAQLANWLASPAIATLGQARGLLRQVAEDVSPEDVAAALQGKKAFIDLDPQSVSPNQTVRLTLRFRDPILNGAAALAAIRCEWEFQDPTRETRPEPSWFERVAGFVQRRGKSGGTRIEPEPASQPSSDGRPVPPPVLERGWRVHRYFEPNVAQQRILVRFFRNGDPITIENSDNPYSRVVAPRVQDQAIKDHRERLVRFWFQTVQMLAVLLVPLVTLALTTAGEPSSGRWWDLIGLGFGSEAIRNIVTGEQK